MKKPWTPDHCPLQVGSVVYDPHTNSDRMVVRRYLGYEDACTDEEKVLVVLDTDMLYSGKDLMEMDFTYYPDWPCTLDENPCYDVVEDEPDFVKLSQCIFEGLKESKYAVKGIHWAEDGDHSVWADGLATAVNNAADDLAKIFKEYKHDEQ